MSETKKPTNSLTEILKQKNKNNLQKQTFNKNQSNKKPINTVTRRSGRGG